MFCAHCGARQPDDTLYCTECGAKLEKANFSGSGTGAASAVQYAPETRGGAAVQYAPETDKQNKTAYAAEADAKAAERREELHREYSPSSSRYGSSQQSAWTEYNAPQDEVRDEVRGVGTVLRDFFLWSGGAFDVIAALCAGTFQSRVNFILAALLTLPISFLRNARVQLIPKAWLRVLLAVVLFFLACTQF